LSEVDLVVFNLLLDLWIFPRHRVVSSSNVVVAPSLDSVSKLKRLQIAKLTQRDPAKEGK
jgi:hypothetical protein